MPHEGLMSDLLWSDPEENIKGYCANPRGAGYTFGGDKVDEFCHNNQIDLVCRAHQLVTEGYKYILNIGFYLRTNWSPYGLRPIIAIGVAILLPYLSSMKT